MKTSLLRGFIFFAGILLFTQCTYAQRKLLILGSSTSTCFFGPSSIDSCYITRLQKYYQSIGFPITLDNRAVAGDNIYQGMPLNYTPPPGRNSPRPYNNITEGLAGNPDVVLINYPSNGYDIFTVDEVMNCFRIIKQAANNAGKPCYITTSQPRNDPESYRTQEVRNKMAEIKNRILSEFGSYAVNFWDVIANSDNSLQDMYQVDGIHINDAGHRIFFNRLLEKNIFSLPVTPSPAAGSGLSYKYYEGDWSTLPDFNSLQPVKSGSVSNIDMSARNRNDYYAFLWEGYISIPTAGNYTFEIVSDDGSKLYFNTTYSAGANALVSNDGLHPAQSVSNSINISAAGSYPIAISFFEKNGGEQMQVYWSGPGFSRQLIPNDAFTGQPTSTGGLTYKYFEGDWNVLPDFNALQPVKSGSMANIEMSPRNRTDYYAFLWQGSITIPASGNYTFELVSDDGSKLYFNVPYSAGATAFVSNDGLHPAQSASNSMYINAGSYPIAISFFEKNGGEQMQVYWSGPGIPRQLIPNSAFSGITSSTGGLKYKYYEGEWGMLPDFNALQPVKSGSVANVDMSARNRTDNYAFLWEGYIKIPVAGNYNFETISDDGSKLYFNSTYNVNANAVVSNDGLHAPNSVLTNIYIASAGVYPITITFFERTGSEQMQVYWSGPGFGRQPIPNEAFSTTPSFSGNMEVNGQSQTLAGSSSESNRTVNAFPNPFNRILNIAYYNTSTSNDISAGLYDLSGKLVHKEYFKNIPAGSGMLKVNLKDRQSIADGIYFLKIDVNGIPFKVLKLVKSKG